MPIVADASVAIRGDLTGFHRDLQGAERATGGLAGRIKDIFSPRNVIAGAGLFGVGLGVRQLVSYAGDAAQAYGELQQTVRTIDAVFGESASVIHDWGKTAADTAGMSQQTFMSSAAVMGQTLLNMGFAADEAADKTVLLLQRAADMALAFGKRPQDALIAITAAMRGERDTIEKFGVAIKQVDVNARVAALGLDTSTAAAKKNAEAIAVVDLVLSQSAEQAGRFAASQDDIAVKMAQASAKIEDFTTTQVGPAVASIQLGAFKVADAVGGYFDTASGNIEAFAMNFGEQHVEVLRLADEAGMSYEEMKQRLIKAMRDTGGGFEDAVEVIETELAGMTSTSEEEFMASARAAGNGVAAMEEALKLGGPVIAAEAGKIAGMLPSEIQARIDDIRQAGMDSVVAFAAGLLQKQKDPMLAWEAMLQANEDALTRQEEITRLQGMLQSTELAAGLNDGRPEVRLAAQAARAEIVERLRTLNAWQWGYNVGSSLAQGMADAAVLVRQQAVSLSSLTGGAIRIESEPDDPRSGLRGITKWGGNIVKTLVGGMYDELGTAHRAGVALSAALAPAMPSQAMGFGTPTGVAAGGRTYILQVNGVPYQVRSPEEIVERLTALAPMTEGRLP